MDNSLRSPVINLVAAVIVGASLIISASIVARKPEALGAPSPAEAPSSSSAPAPAVDGRPLAAPPIAQDSVSSQFREQVLAAPDVHTRKANKQTFTLTDVKVKQVVYSAKDDTFTIRFDWVWDRPMARPDGDVATLTNDGYGHYYGSTGFGGMYEGGDVHLADVTIR